MIIYVSIDFKHILWKFAANPTATVSQLYFHTNFNSYTCMIIPMLYRMLPTTYRRIYAVCENVFFNFAEYQNGEEIYQCSCVCKTTFHEDSNSAWLI